MFKRYILNWLVGLDQWVNTWFAGDPDETISSRLGKSHRGDYGVIAIYVSLPFWLIVNTIFWILEYPLWNHCERSIEKDEGRDDLLI